MNALLEKSTFGTLPDGRVIDKFVLSNANGMKMEVITYGGIITSLQVPDRNGVSGDIVLGFDSLEEYLDEHPYFGAIIGRFGNRISNGSFTLDGREYHLAKNLGKHHLHGGTEGFDRKVWNAEIIEAKAGTGLQLSYTSPDGEEGYPGNLSVKVTYILTEDDSLIIRYDAASDATTVLNLTQHSYFNLNGVNSDIHDHLAEFKSQSIVETDEDLIPTGRIIGISGTPFDFSSKKAVGRDIDTNNPLLLAAGGYDHCYVLDKDEEDLLHCASVHDPESGRTMDVFTTEPGFQFYTANSLGKMQGKGKEYNRRMAFCIETQHFPDSPNRPEFPSTRLNPGKPFTSETRYVFTSK